MRRTLLAVALATAFLAVPVHALSADIGGSVLTAATRKHAPKKPSMKKPSTRKKEVHVRDYRRKNGTYVAPHTRTAPKG